MKRGQRSRLASFVLTTLLLATSCSRLPRNSKTLFVMVPKLVGIPYFNSARDGASQEASRLGLHFFYTGPTAADASLQVDVIAGLLARHPAVLAVSCDDANALAPVLRRARRYGIPVLTWDADAQQDARDWFVSQVEDETLGRHVMDVLAEQLGGRGQYAIITGSLTASNLNAWLYWMKKQQQEKYPGMELVAVVAGQRRPAAVLRAGAELGASLPESARIHRKQFRRAACDRESHRASRTLRQNCHCRALDTQSDAALY